MGAGLLLFFFDFLEGHIHGSMQPLLLITLAAGGHHISFGTCAAPGNGHYVIHG